MGRKAGRIDWWMNYGAISTIDFFDSGLYDTGNCYKGRWSFGGS
jgi:hypothetical protein